MKKVIVSVIGILFVFVLWRTVTYYSNPTWFVSTASGASMAPTFRDKDQILIHKTTLTISRGDIVLFHAPPAASCPENTGCDFLKRVVGIPKDRILIKEKTVFLNGNELREPYLFEQKSTLPSSFAHEGQEIVLGPNQYFLLGDNRAKSADSRVYGTVDKENIIGVVVKKL